MKDIEIKLLGDLQRLETKPGDRFVLKMDADISADMAEKLQQHWRLWSKSEFGDLLILGKGISLSVIGKEPE